MKKISYLIFSLIIFFMNAADICFGQCLADQKSLLIDIKSSLVFDASLSVKLANWDHHLDCCTWPGVHHRIYVPWTALIFVSEYISMSQALIFVSDFVSGYVVFKYKQKWWQRYNYILSGGLDAGTAFMTALLFMMLGSRGVGLDWWGNNPEGCPLATCPTAKGVTVAGCPTF